MTRAQIKINRNILDNMKGLFEREPISKILMEINPVIPSHGACKLFFPWFNNSPNDALPGGKPNPKKSREVSDMIPPIIFHGRYVMVATTALGSMWRIMIIRSLTPRVLAAITYSRFRVRRNSARTTPTNLIQPKINITNNKPEKLGLIKLVSIINK